jgi:acetyltransferase-like isoleucine patch superfamily enzyme
MSGLFSFSLNIFLKLMRIPSYLICKMRSEYYSLKIDEGGGKIIITEPFISFKIKRHKDSKVCIKGVLKIVSHLESRTPILITIGKNSQFILNGDFTIGSGVKFCLAQNSTLIIGGKESESDSGITADTLVMVSKKIEIGVDFLCAWDVFITDSDWHQINDQNHQSDVKIGNHVWIANSNNILKGSVIGDNCIIASNSKTNNKTFPNNSLIGGIPPRILRTNIQWSRDIIDIKN